MNSFSANETPLINYDCAGLVEVEIDDVHYRLDAGKQGTALCISTRAPGTYDWQFLSEARWDGRDLRVKALDRAVLQRIGLALRAATENE